MKPEDILRFDRMVPRYTSYPTAADFTDAVDDRPGPSHIGVGSLG